MTCHSVFLRSSVIELQNQVIHEDEILKNWNTDSNGIFVNVYDNGFPSNFVFLPQIFLGIHIEGWCDLWHCYPNYVTVKRDCLRLHRGNICPPSKKSLRKLTQITCMVTQNKVSQRVFSIASSSCRRAHVRICTHVYWDQFTGSHSCLVACTCGTSSTRRTCRAWNSHSSIVSHSCPQNVRTATSSGFLDSKSVWHKTPRKQAPSPVLPVA